MLVLHVVAGLNALCRSFRCRPAAQAADGESLPQQVEEYIGSDGRKKATFEESFRLGRDHGSKARMPWQFSWQRNERSLKFNDETRAHMVKGFAARELAISEPEMDRRLAELVLLLPELPTKLAVMKPAAVAHLAADTNALAVRLVRLKAVFPGANVASMVVKQPALLMERDDAHMAAAAQQLKELLPRFDRDWVTLLIVDMPAITLRRLVEQHPQIVLDVDTFAETLEEARRMLPNQDILRTLQQNPSMIFGFERRSSMIPYDS